MLHSNSTVCPQIQIIRPIQCSQPNPSPYSGHNPAVVIVRHGLGLQWQRRILPRGPVFTLSSEISHEMPLQPAVTGIGRSRNSCCGLRCSCTSWFKEGKDHVKVKSLELCREQSLLEEGRSLHCLELSQRQWFGWGRINCIWGYVLHLC